MRTISGILVADESVSVFLALCRHCARERRDSGLDLEELASPVVSGICHDCGAGYCLCRGAVACERCPRQNCPGGVIVTELVLYGVSVPPPSSTNPRPVGR